MVFLPVQNNQLTPLTTATASAGGTTSFFQNFDSVYDKQYRVDSLYALEGEMRDIYDKNTELLRQFVPDLGSDMADVSYGPFTAWAERALGQGTRDEDLLKAFDERDAMIEEIRRKNPESGLLTMPEIFEQVKKLRGEIDSESSSVGSRAGFTGTLGGFLGGMVGSFTLRDPLLLGTLGWGGVGRTLGMKLLTEAGVAMGIEGVQQYGFIEPTRAALGEQPGNPAMNVLFAGAGAAAFRGAFAAPAPAYRAVEEALFPQRAAARAIRDVISEEAALPLSTLMERVAPQRLSSEELIEAVSRLRQTPEVRAATFGLEQERFIRDNNPFGDTPAGLQRLEREMQRTEAMFNGEPIPQHLSADTAVGRFIDNSLVPLDESFSRAVGRSDFPELYREFDRAKERLAEAEARVQEALEAIEGRTMVDVLEEIDPVSASRVREIESELDQAIPRARREALERELDQVVESIGPDAIREVEAGNRTRLTRALRSARASRKAAKAEYNRLLKGVDAVEQRVAAPTRELDMVLSPNDRAIQQLPATPAMARALGNALDETTPRIPVEADTIVARAVQEDGTIDVGMETPVRADLEVPLTDLGETMTARAIMDDLAGDEAMLNAMRSCAI